MTSALKIRTAISYLRRKYSGDLAGLRALADTVAENATTPVTLTGQSYEGGGHSGVVTFAPMEYLAAIEALIAELDPAAAQPGDLVIEADFSTRNALS